MNSFAFTYLALVALVVAMPQATVPAPWINATVLDVKIAMIGNTKVRATISNVGGNEVEILNIGTFLDPAPVKKIHISDTCKTNHPLFRL